MCMEECGQGKVPDSAAQAKQISLSWGEPQSGNRKVNHYLKRFPFLRRGQKSLDHTINFTACTFISFNSTWRRSRGE